LPSGRAGWVRRLSDDHKHDECGKPPAFFKEPMSDKPEMSPENLINIETLFER
jgi:hypothetical protein